MKEIIDETQSMIDLLLDEHADKGGSTRASRLLAAIALKEQDAKKYELLCRNLFREIPYRDWPFFCKLYSFAVGANFDKDFFVACAAFIKKEMAEPEASDQDFVSDNTISCNSGLYHDIYNYTCIVESSPRFTARYP